MLLREEAYFWSPAVDVYLLEDRIVVYVELPGLTSDDVEVETRDGSLLIRGEKRLPPAGGTADSLEIRTGHFERKIELPTQADPSKSVAEMKDGLLRIVVPRGSGTKVSVPIREQKEEN